MNRRDFLRSAAALGTFSIVPAKALFNGKDLSNLNGTSLEENYNNQSIRIRELP